MPGPDLFKEKFPQKKGRIHRDGQIILSDVKISRFVKTAYRNDYAVYP